MCTAKNKAKTKPTKTIEPATRYCTVEESLKDSLREVKDIRDRKHPAMTLNDLFKNIEKWRNFNFEKIQP